MDVQGTENLAKAVGAAPRAPSLLLDLLAAALLACLAAVAVFFLYLSFTNTVSSHRRQMNAAAYNAQLFFDRRESLLRSLASAAVRRAIDAPVSEAQRYFSETQQFEVLPLLEDSNTYDWALILTPLDLKDISRARTRLLFSSARTGQTSLIVPGQTSDSDNLGSGKQAWLARELAATEPSAHLSGNGPIVWLNPPADQANRPYLYMYTPVDPATLNAGWIGLEVGGIDTAIDLASLRGGSGVLFDPHGIPVIHAPDAPVLAELGQWAGQEDSFGWWGSGLLPQFVVLNKSVGEAGWRVVYYIAISQILRDTALAIPGVLAGAVLLFAAVVLGARRIKRRLAAPTGQQYEALADSAALNLKLVEFAPLGLCLLRRTDGVPLLSNEVARRWLLSDSYLLHRHFSSDSSYSAREFVLRDGRSVYITYSLDTYRGQDVVLCGIIDITDFKGAERSVMQAKLDADVANHAKTVFLATMSHEIRTPLFGILGTLEMLRLTTVDSRQQQYLDTMQHSSATLLRTINDTLDLTRIEAGHLKLESSTFYPAELLDAVVSSYAARAETKGLHLYGLAEVTASMAVVGDLAHIRQILNNLVSNAIKFTNSGQVVLRLQMLPLDTKCANLKFQVADSGIGIASKHHTRLFDPFFRVENDHPQTVPGTGLGLAICRRLSVMMGGTLTAVSELGLGTSMSLEITLPLAGELQSAPAIRLDPEPIFVRGAVSDVVNNLCQWLRHWGAVAMPYKTARHGGPERGVLVEAWPRDMTPAVWSGARVVAQPPGASSRLEGTRDNWMANAHSLASIAAAVRLAQDGVAAKASLELKNPRDALGMHVLVVEDNLVSQQILREQLEHLGCTAVLASNGSEALACSDLLAFDAILTDLQMPEMDGYDLTRALRNQGYTHPILGITASAFTDDLRRGKIAGMTAVLLKPLSIAALRQTLSAFKEIIR